MRYKTKGFTLIELIVVIIILGILAAVAIPRFADMSKEARASTVEGLRGAISSASIMAHGIQQAQRLGPNDSITMNGVTVTMLNGYPTANAAGIDNTLGLGWSDYYTSDGSGQFSPTGVTTAANCNVTYVAATASVPATTTTDTSDCS